MIRVFIALLDIAVLLLFTVFPVDTALFNTVLMLRTVVPSDAALLGILPMMLCVFFDIALVDSVQILLSLLFHIRNDTVL